MQMLKGGRNRARFHGIPFWKIRNRESIRCKLLVETLVSAQRRAPTDANSYSFLIRRQVVICRELVSPRPGHRPLSDVNRLRIDGEIRSPIMVYEVCNGSEADNRHFMTRNTAYRYWCAFCRLQFNEAKRFSEKSHRSDPTMHEEHGSEASLIS